MKVSGCCDLWYFYLYFMYLKVPYYLELCNVVRNYILKGNIAFVIFYRRVYFFTVLVSNMAYTNLVCYLFLLLL